MSAPAKFAPISVGKFGSLVDVDGAAFATFTASPNVYPAMRERADAIVRAVNAHDELVAAAARVLAALDRMPSNPADGLADDLRAAIAKAGAA